MVILSDIPYYSALFGLAIWWPPLIPYQKSHVQKNLGMVSLTRKGRTSYFCMVLMMENILHHVGCIVPCNSWDKLWTSTGGRISEPSVCWLVDSIRFRISFLRNQWMEWFLCAEEAEYVWTTVAYVISQVGCPGNGSRDLKRMLNDLLIYKSWTIHGYQHGSHRFFFGDLKIWSNFTTTTQNNVFFLKDFFSSDFFLLLLTFFECFC